MSELKSCPFCGASIDIWEHKYPNGETFFEPLGWHDEGCILDHVLWCGDYTTETELIEAWNRRAGEDGKVY